MEQNDFMKKIKIVIFVCALTLPWLLWYGWGTAWPAYQASHSYELNENRNIYELEDGFENFFNDRIPFRTALIHDYNQAVNVADQTYKASLEKDLIARWYHEEGQNTAFLNDAGEYEWLIYGEDTDLMQAEDHIHDFYVAETVEPTLDGWGYTRKVCNVCGKELKTDFVAKEIDSSYIPPTMNDKSVMVGRNDWLFVFDFLNYYSLYTGEKDLPKRDLSARANVLQKLQDLCDKNNTTFAYLIAPAKYQVYPEYLQSLEVVDETKPTQKIVDYLTENTTSTVIYPIDEISSVNRYYQTYFRYDSHWNQIGAYVGTEVLYRNLGLEITPLNDLKISLDESEETGWMDLLPLTGMERSEFQHKDYDYLIDYKSDVSVTDEKGNPLFGENAKVDVNMLPVEEYTSESGEDAHIVVIGDSFRAMPRQYIAKDFKRSTFIHFYSLNETGYLEDYGLDYANVIKQIKADLDDADYLVFVANEGYEEMAVHYQELLRRAWEK